MNAALPPASPGPGGTASREGVCPPARAARAFCSSPSARLVSGAGCFYPPGQQKMSFLQWPSLLTPSPNLSVRCLLEPLYSPGAGLLPGQLGRCCRPGMPSSGADTASGLAGCSDLLSYLISDEYTQNYLPKTGHWEIHFKFFHVQNVLIPSLYVMFGVGIREMFKMIPPQSFEGIALWSSALKLVIHNGVPLKVVELVIFF